MITLQSSHNIITIYSVAILVWPTDSYDIPVVNIDFIDKTFDFAALHRDTVDSDLIYHIIFPICNLPGQNICYTVSGFVIILICSRQLISAVFFLDTDRGIIEIVKTVLKRGTLFLHYRKWPRCRMRRVVANKQIGVSFVGESNIVDVYICIDTIITKYFQSSISIVLSISYVFFKGIEWPSSVSYCWHRRCIPGIIDPSNNMLCRIRNAIARIDITCRAARISLLSIALRVWWGMMGHHSVCFHDQGGRLNLFIIVIVISQWW